VTESAKNKGFIYEFGKFVLDPQERVLLDGGKPVHLTEKVFDTLLFLIENNGRLLTKEEMMSSIWEESFVEEGNLAKNISRLRKILNTDGAGLLRLTRNVSEGISPRWSADGRKIIFNSDRAGNFAIYEIEVSF